MKTGAAVLLVIFFHTGSKAQDVRWPITYYAHKGPRRIIYPDVRNGYIVTSKGDTVKGYIKMNQDRNSQFAVLDTASKTIRGVYIWDIVMIRAYNGRGQDTYSDYYNCRIWPGCGSCLHEKMSSASINETWTGLRIG